MSEKKSIVSVLIPNDELDELAAREAFAKGGAKMGMSQLFLTLLIESVGGPAEIMNALERRREEQKHIPPSAFKRGKRKRLFAHV